MMASMEAQNEQFVQSLIALGEFSTSDEVIDAAVERWRTQRDEFAALRAKVQLGIEELDRGEGAPLNVEDVIPRGQERLATRNSTD